MIGLIHSQMRTTTGDFDLKTSPCCLRCFSASAMGPDTPLLVTEYDSLGTRIERLELRRWSEATVSSSADN